MHHQGATVESSRQSGLEAHGDELADSVHRNRCLGYSLLRWRRGTDRHSENRVAVVSVRSAINIGIHWSLPVLAEQADADRATR